MIEKNLKEHIDCFRDLAGLRDPILQAAKLLADSLRQGGKILICGNGGSAADAQHFAAELVGRFLRDRTALPAIALTTDTSIITAVGNDYGFADIFARQVEALGQPRDVLIALSTSGASTNTVHAVEAALARQMMAIAMTGADGGPLSTLANITIAVPCRTTPRIQEAHCFILHCWAGSIEAALLDQKDNG